MIKTDEIRIRSAEGEGLVKFVGEILEGILKDMKISVTDTKENLNIRRDKLGFIFSYFKVPGMDDVNCDLSTKDITFETLKNYIIKNINYEEEIVEDLTSEQELIYTDSF